MYLVLKREWEALNATDPADHHKQAVIPVGRLEVERIPNPFGFAGSWLMLKGTKIGAGEEFWRQWSDEEYDGYQVVIEE